MARTLTAAGPDRANRMIFYGAIALALIAAVAVFATLANFGSDEGGAVIGDTVEVVVASQDIDAGDEIGADMVELASLPVNAVIDAAYTDQSFVAGTRAKERILRGDQLAPAKVNGGGEAEQSVSNITPLGRRAMAVRVSPDTAGGGNILPGDRVDVVLVAETAVEGTTLSQGTLLLQDVEVLAVAQETLRPVGRTDTNGEPIVDESALGSIAAPARDAQEDPEAETVMLSVLPEDVPLLALAQEEGTLYLALRGLGDDGVIEGGVERNLP